MTSAAVPAIVLGLLGLIWIAILARIFFLPGKWNLSWWLNTGPFIVAGTVMLGVLVGRLEPLVASTSVLGVAMAVTGTVLEACALGLSGWTLGTHRRRLALWHQTDDHPEHLVTEGPYRVVRHPFYSSYILNMVGCVLAAPHGATLAMLMLVAYRLNGTAAREEARFLASEGFGQAYSAYVSRTGRFIPRRPQSGAAWRGQAAVAAAATSTEKGSR